MRGPGGSCCAILAAAALLALVAPSAATAATVVNGDFESGTLSGWHVRRTTESANWFAYEGNEAPIGRKREKPLTVQPPPQGRYAAITDEAIPDSLILYQDIALEPGYSHRLSMLVFYNSYRPIAIPKPDTLSVDEEVLAGRLNQQYRIDVMRPDAPIESLDPADILLTPFELRKGDPEALSPTRVTADLSSFAGQTVRLRIASVAHEETLNAGVDAVSIASSPPGGQSPGPGHGSRLFSLLRIDRNRQNGTVTLRVRVSGPGALTARSASGSSGASSSKAKKPRALIKPATVRVASAGTVALRLAPTPPARRLLRQRHKLRAKVALTFRPVGGAPESMTTPVLFELVRRARMRR